MEGLSSGRNCELLWVCLTGGKGLIMCRYGEDKTLTEDYQKDIWMYGF